MIVLKSWDLKVLQPSGLSRPVIGFLYLYLIILHTSSVAVSLMSLLITTEVTNCLTVFDVYCGMKRLVISN